MDDVELCGANLGCGRPKIPPQVPYRQPNQATAEDELHAYVSEAKAELASLDEAEGISQEALEFEFNV
ncbi:MAG: hypothetical protein ACLQVM_08095 [Terriglobia bacterium]